MEQIINKTLRVVSPNKIAPNPYNPRIIFEPESMEELKKSIKKVGILVPLTVYVNTKNSPKEEFILLDGERRWRCAKEIGLESVPVNVIDEPADVTQNILYMFNIHHYRKEWELFPTALKLETIMNDLGTDSEKQISEFTGVSRSMIRRCKMLLWYPKKYRSVLMEKSGKVSTDFFIELYPIIYRLSHEEEYYENSKVEELVDRLIEIFESGEVIRDVKEFREIRKAMGYFEKNGEFFVFKNMIQDFLNGGGIEKFEEINSVDDRNRKNIHKYISYLTDELSKLNTDYMSDFSFINELTNLHERIMEVLERID